MTDQTSNQNADVTADKADDLQLPDQLEFYKQKARTMGINPGNMGVEALKAKIRSKLEGAAETATENAEGSEARSEQVNPLAGGAPNRPLTKMERRQQLVKEATRLIRCRITNLDPKKADLPGEIIAVGNGVIGTIKKFVPFGEVTDNGYHIPKIIYDELCERRFLSIKTRKGPRGTPVVEQQWAKEFAIDVLPPLTPQELKDLAAAQTAKGGLDN